MMNPVYENPKYYEIAMSFRDISAEVDTFESCFKKYAQLPVKSILEIGCGNSPHLEELLKRGYVYTGLDISKAMLAYSSQKAATLDGKATFIQADMIDFSISQTFDFAFIALGSLYARNTEDIFSHFRSVAQALNKGGLYLLDWCIHFAPISAQDDAWSIEQENIKVTTHYSEKYIDAVEQLIEETISLDVQEGDSTQTFSETSINRVIFPQEFLQIIKHTKEFEFVGWWNNWDLEKPLSEIKDPEKISRPIALLRKK
jgi:SAM-dependent methyltransferase